MLLAELALLPYLSVIVAGVSTGSAPRVYGIKTKARVITPNMGGKCRVPILVYKAPSLNTLQLAHPDVD